MLQFLNSALFTFLQNAWGGAAPETPAHIANFDFKIVSKNCANFVLNRAAILKFCVAPLLEICPKDISRASTLIANFCYEMVSENCANLGLNCAAIFKLCAVPPPETSPKNVLKARFSIANFRSEMVSKNCANFVLNFEILCSSSFCKMLVGVGMLGSEDVRSLPPLRILTLKWY